MAGKKKSVINTHLNLSILVPAEEKNLQILILIHCNI